MVHYVFANIHPYYDFNGRMARLVHLWVLADESHDEYWKLIFLSESIYSFKDQYSNAFDKILKAKNNEANIDLTYFTGKMLDIFYKHTKAYIKMKAYCNASPKVISKTLRIFIIDMICLDAEKWFTINDFKKEFPDYSSSTYGNILKEIRFSNIFDIKESNPLRFKLKKI